jgi:pimeloyl-ACP methyl ester carboxylesterase
MTAQVEGTELAKQVRVPTLVLHCNGDRVAPLEEGRDMARLIPGASFIELPGNNHALLALAGTPAFDQFIEEATNFVATHTC